RRDRPPGPSRPAGRPGTHRSHGRHRSRRPGRRGRHRRPRHHGRTVRHRWPLGHHLHRRHHRGRRALPRHPRNPRPHTYPDRGGHPAMTGHRATPTSPPPVPGTPTQTAHPWRSVLRTFVAAGVGVAVAWLVRVLGIDLTPFSQPMIDSLTAAAWAVGTG